jgi:sugar phosphate isomerase/epimerase
MLSRRQCLSALAGGAALACQAAAPPARSRLGVVLYSYAIRTRAERGLADPLRFAAFCHERGADGVQLPIGVRDASYVRGLRDHLARWGLYLEGSVRSPRQRGDLDRFEAEVRTAKAAGVDILRTVMLGGRRYETFRTAAAYRAFKEQARQSLQMTLPILARHGVLLAVENHKDYRADELAELMRGLKSDHVGVCVDLGNNLALLDNPVQTVQVLAPWALTCHLKDMAVAESADGFLLAEVPLGEGILDLKRLVTMLRRARPGMRFGLEMITREPLRVPCLGETYLATLGDVPARDLARTLALVRRRAWKTPPPPVRTASLEKQLAAEDRHVRQSLAYARRHLGL